jgi:hypothetical protein
VENAWEYFKFSDNYTTHIPIGIIANIPWVSGVGKSLENLWKFWYF